MKYLGSGRSGSFAWLFQRVSGVALVVILGIHFIVLHYSGTGSISSTRLPRVWPIHTIRPFSCCSCLWPSTTA